MYKVVNKTAYIFVIYLFVALVYSAVFFPDIRANLLWPTWLIAPIMAFGSFVAGSTFLGGGSVAFPALTKLLGVNAIDAKLFSLAIQSVGMSAASFYIIGSVRNIPIAFIGLYSLGSLLGLLFSLSHLSHIIAATDLRIIFSAFLLCFLIVYLFTQESRHTNVVLSMSNTCKDLGLTLSCGMVGGIISGLIGSGADLIGFCLMALYFQLNIKRATQISVILMAISSLIGLSIHTTLFSPLSADALSLWYIAAPIVLFGAPFGAIVCKRVSSKVLLTFISIIVVCEVTSTFYLIPLDSSRLVFYFGGGVFLAILLMGLQHLSKNKHEHVDPN